MSNPMTIWCNVQLNGAAATELSEGVEPHRLLIASQRTGNLSAGGADPDLERADIAFGQPDVEQIMRLSSLRWIHLSSAGYTRYDRQDVRDALGRRNAILTNSSSVYDEPCAEHLLAFLLSGARHLSACWANQAGPRGWPIRTTRANSRLLIGQTVLMLGFGAIARRLAELLAPLHMNLIAVRRKVRGDEPIQTLPVEELNRLLPQADHVMNILPASQSTERLITAEHFGAMKKGAIFHNIGRGTTIDQAALIAALESGHLAGAYLDVTDPEPLPPNHPLWTTPGCVITPHSGGGHDTEFSRLAQHFLQNLRKFESGTALSDRVF